MVVRAVIPIQRQWRCYLEYQRTLRLINERGEELRRTFARIQVRVTSLAHLFWTIP